MKKTKISTILLLAFLSFFFYKTEANDTTYISSRYTGGEKTLRKFISSHLMFPKESFNNCIVGTSLSSIKINNAGEIVDIKIINSLGQDIDKQVMMVLKVTKGRWIKDNKATNDNVFYFQIVFKIKGNDFFKPTIKSANLMDDLTIIGMGNLKCNFISDEKLLGKINSTLKEKSYNKLLPLLNEAIRRNPYNRQFYELRIQCYSNLKMDKSLIVEDNLKITKLIDNKTIEELLVK